MTPSDPRVGPLLADLYARWAAGVDATPADLTTDRDLIALLEAAVEADLGPTAAALGGRAEDAPPRGVVGRFEVGSIHKVGGMGAVYLAAEPALGRTVAYKVIHHELACDPGAVGRFCREAALAAALDHAGVVPVYARVTDGDGRPAYAMRYVKGPDLSAWAAGGSAVSPGRPPTPPGWRDVAGLFVGLCGAVAHAHRAGILHRDLTPRNILIDPAGLPVVVDWGLARRVDDPDGGAVLPTGWTPGFAAPELAERPGRHSVQSDVYSLGAILHVLLTGRPPAAAGRPGVRPPRPLDAVSRKATSPDPADRYPTADDLAADVRAWLAGERVAADAEPWAETAARWAGRHRTTVVAAAAALLVFAVGGVVAAVREAELRRQADSATATAQAAEVAAGLARDVATDERNRTEEARAAAAAEQARADAATDEIIAQAETVAASQASLPAVRRILDRGREHLDRLAAAAAADPARRAAAASAHFRAARIRYKLNQFPEAESASRAALGLSGPEADPVLRAAVLTQLGVLVFRGKPAAATPLWDEAVHLLAGRPGLDLRGQLVLARAYMARGNVALIGFNLAAAETQYDLAAAAAGTVLAADPNDVTARFLASEVESNRGAARLRLNPTAPDRALAAHRAAFAHRRVLLDRDPGNPDYKAYLAATRNHIANALAARGGDDVRAAVVEYTSALDLLEPLVVAFPGVPSHRQEVGMALHNLGLALGHLGRVNDAVLAGRRAVGLYAGLTRGLPDDLELNAQLAVVGRALVLRLRKIGAAQEADDLTYQVAVAQAVVGRSSPDADDRAAATALALEGIAELGRRGYFTGANGERVAGEPAFAGLRSVQEFLTAIGTPKK